MIYDYFRVTGADDTVLDYGDLFSVTLRDDNVQEFHTRWDEVLLSLSKIPSDDVLESLQTEDTSVGATQFQYCLNPNYLQQFLYLRAIQGHSGSAINPSLQDNVLLPQGFTEYMFITSETAKN